MAIQKILTREFILCFFAQFAFTSAFHILIPTLPIYLSRLGSTEIEIGLLIGIVGVSSLVFKPFVGRPLLKIPEKNFMFGGALLFTISSSAYPVASPFWPFLIVRVFQGIAIAFFYTASVTLIANISPEAHRGRSLSYFYLAFNISFALAPSFGMFLMNLFDITFLTKHRFQYYLVWIPKHRKRVLRGKIVIRLKRLIYEACKINRWWLWELSIQEDHVHVMMQTKPKDSMAEVVHILKEGTSRAIREEILELEEFLWGDSFWADGIFCRGSW